MLGLCFEERNVFVFISVWHLGHCNRSWLCMLRGAKGSIKLNKLKPVEKISTCCWQTCLTHSVWFSFRIRIGFCYLRLIVNIFRRNQLKGSMFRLPRLAIWICCSVYPTPNTSVPLDCGSTFCLWYFSQYCAFYNIIEWEIQVWNMYILD